MQELFLDNIEENLTLNIRDSRISHNMSTEAPKGTDQTTEQVRDRLVEFVKATEFGSSEYQAVSDYFALQSLEVDLHDYLSNVVFPEDDEGRIRNESRARITEMELVLHKDRIRQRKSQLKGYELAHNWIHKQYDLELPMAVYTESMAEFPSDSEKQTRRAANLNGDVYKAVQSAISLKRE